MTDFPDVKLKALVNFPASAVGRVGIDVEKDAGTYFIDLDYEDFAPPISSVPPADVPNLNGLLWNSATGSYVLAPLTLIGDAGTGLADAASDGFYYGRNGAAWQKVLGLAGGTMGGMLTLATDPVGPMDAVTKEYADGHSASLTFDTRAAAQAAFISPVAINIVVRRYASDRRLSNAPYKRGDGVLPLIDAFGATWSLDLSGEVIRATWFGIHGDGINDDYGAMQALANVASGSSVLIEGRCLLAQKVIWPSNVTVFGNNPMLDAFVAAPGVDFEEGLAYVNNQNNVRFQRLGWFGNLVQTSDNYTIGAIYFVTDYLGSGGIQLEVSDCYFAGFKQASWIFIASAADTRNISPIRFVKVVRNEVFADAACAPTDFPEKTGNYFLRVHGNTAFDEPSVSGTITNVLFAQNQVYGLGLAGVYEGLFNQGNLAILNNICEYIGNNTSPDFLCYCFAVYNSHPTSIDPYVIAIIGNLVNGAQNNAVYVAGPRDLAVANNVFRNVSTGPNTSLPVGYAIAANGAKNFTCTSNVIIGGPGGIYYGVDYLNPGTDVIADNSITCSSVSGQNATGIWLNPDVLAALTDNQTSLLAANNNITVTGAGATGILITGAQTVPVTTGMFGRCTLHNNNIKSDYNGIVGQAIVALKYEFSSNDVHGLLQGYPYLISSTTPVIVRGETVDWSETVAGSSSGANFDNCTKLVLDGLTLMNKTNSLGALSMVGAQGFMDGVVFRNCATQVVAGSLGLAMPAFTASIGHKVQNLAKAELGSTPKYVVDHWLNLSGSTAWLEQRQGTQH